MKIVIRGEGVFPAPCIGPTSGRAWKGGKRGGRGGGTQSCPSMFYFVIPFPRPSDCIVSFVISSPYASLFVPNEAVCPPGQTQPKINPSSRSKLEKKKNHRARAEQASAVDREMALAGMF